MRRLHLPLAVCAIALGAFAWYYTGPARPWVRGHVGDVAAAILVYAALGLVWRGRPLARAVLAFSFAAALEVGQSLWQVSSLAGELTLGDTFDPIDFAAYAAGVAIGLGYERSTRYLLSQSIVRRHARSAPASS